jgi:RHS repeat-associated protein
VFDKESHKTLRNRFFDLRHFEAKRLDRELSRWLTIDPAGFIDSFNLYQYVLNNPFRYQDPQGGNLLGYLCGIGQIVAGGALIITGGILEVATLGGYTIGFGIQTQAGLVLMTSGLAMTTYHAQGITFFQKLGS